MGWSNGSQGNLVDVEKYTQILFLCSKYVNGLLDTVSHSQTRDTAVQQATQRYAQKASNVPNGAFLLETPYTLQPKPIH